MAFIQACQGENIAVVPPASLQSDGDSRHTCDFIMSSAAFYGQKSFRAANGTWYINVLCKIFKENYKTMDAVSMITHVHKEVTNMKSGYSMQCASSVRHNVHFAVKGGWGRVFGHHYGELSRWLFHSVIFL